MRRLFSILSALAVVAGCGGSAVTAAPGSSATPGLSPTIASPAQSTIPSPEATAACPLQLGVAGLIPAHYPDQTATDWTNLYVEVPETGSLLGVYTNWTDSAATEGQIPQGVATGYGLGSQYGFTPLVALGFYRDAASGGGSTVAWSDAAQRNKAVAAAVAIATKYKPGLLGLGVEVNRQFEHDPKGFDAFVAAYAEMYDAVKAASPSTLVFPILQFEMTRGKGYLMGDSATRKPEWTLLDRFGARLDAAAFTTYPFFDATSPQALPADYYAEIATHTNRPVVFTEIGWPSAPLSSAPKSAYGGSPEEQAAFVSRFFDLTRPLNLRAALWSFPNDLNAGYPNAAMTSVSLRTNDGTGKPALDVWRARSKAPCEPPA